MRQNSITEFEMCHLAMVKNERKIAKKRLIPIPVNTFLENFWQLLSSSRYSNH